MTAVDGGATIVGPYRYHLWRKLSAEPGPRWLYVMLNPSTADASLDDQTIRRCSFFAAREGAVRFDVVNLYALRSTSPQALLDHPDPVGPDNDANIAVAAAEADLVVIAWGGSIPRALRWRAYDVWEHLQARVGDLWCLGWTETLHPRHPSRLPSAAPLLKVRR